MTASHSIDINRFNDENCKAWESIFTDVSSEQKLMAACAILNIDLSKFLELKGGNSTETKSYRSEHLDERFNMLHNALLMTSDKKYNNPIAFDRVTPLLNQAKEFLDKFVADDCVLDRDDVLSDDILKKCEILYKKYEEAERDEKDRKNIFTYEEYMYFVRRPFTELPLLDGTLNLEKRFMNCFAAMKTENQLEMLQILRLHGDENLDALLKEFKARKQKHLSSSYKIDQALALDFNSDDLFENTKSPVNDPIANTDNSIDRAISSITREIEKVKEEGLGLAKAKMKDQKRKEQKERQAGLFQDSFLNLVESSEQKRNQFIDDFLAMSQDEQIKILNNEKNFNVPNLEALSAQLEKNIKDNVYQTRLPALKKTYEMVQDVIFSVQLTKLENEIRTHHMVKPKSDDEMNVESEKKVKIPINESELDTILDLGRKLKTKQRTTLDNLSMQSVNVFCQDIKDFENTVTRSTILTQKEKLKFMLLAGGLLGAVLAASVLTGGLALASGPATVAAFTTVIESAGIGMIIKGAALGALAGTISTGKLIYDNPTKFFDKPAGVLAFTTQLKDKVDRKNKATTENKMPKQR